MGKYDIFKENLEEEIKEKLEIEKATKKMVNKVQFYKIGEVAKMFDVSTSTLRHWEKIGKITRCARDNNVRVFNSLQIKEIERVIGEESLKVKTQEASYYYTNKTEREENNNDHLIEILKKQLEEKDKQIEKLNEMIVHEQELRLLELNKIKLLEDKNEKPKWKFW